MEEFLRSNVRYFDVLQITENNQKIFLNVPKNISLFEQEDG